MGDVGCAGAGGRGESGSGEYCARSGEKQPTRVEVGEGRREDAAEGGIEILTTGAEARSWGRVRDSETEPGNGRAADSGVGRRKSRRRRREDEAVMRAAHPESVGQTQRAGRSIGDAGHPDMKCA